jgi:hypothetical protein
MEEVSKETAKENSKIDMDEWIYHIMGPTFYLSN